MRNILAKPILILATALPLFAFSQNGRPQDVQPLPKEPGEIKIASWNQNWFPDGSYKTKSAKIRRNTIFSAARFVVSYWDVDVCLFQEMRNLQACKDLVDQMSESKELQDYRLNICSSYPGQLQQDCIISIYPTVDCGYYNWKNGPEVTPPRGFTWAVLDIKGHLVLFATTHWKSNKSQSDSDIGRAEERAVSKKMRDQSSQELLAELKVLEKKTYGERKIEHVFIGGDFNTSFFTDDFKDEKALQRILDAGYTDTFSTISEEERRKADGKGYWPGAVLDYIFYKGPGTVCKPDVSPRSPTSDHALISVVLKF